MTIPITAAPARAFFVACLGIGIFCCMDALMKQLGLALGAYSALLWRTGFGALFTGALFAGGGPRWPGGRRVRLHVGRGLVVTAMALLWFHAITLVPLAEAIAISFIAPLIALLLAALVLREPVGPRAVLGSLLGLGGVAVILAGKFGAPHGPRALEGALAVLGSAVLYAINLVIQRHQAQQAAPREIAFFQTLTVLACLLPFAPWFAVTPTGVQWPLIAGAAAFATVSLLLLSWAYARAEAQVLVPTEYTGFLWLSALGWLFFDEALTIATLLGAVLIVGGCALAIRPARRAPTPQEAML